jgi:tRNA (mo5U34)-methyltransferase
VTLQSESTHDAEIAALGPWFHNLHLPDGRQTAPDHPLGDFPAYKWKGIAPHLPNDLSGWDVLDIGCNAGFYSFELARRGARVCGIDVDERYLRQARWGAEKLGLEERVDFRRGTVYDLAGIHEQWDLVLFLGVLYHLRYPLLGLDIVARRVRELLVLQTLTMPGEERLAQATDLSLDQRSHLLAPGWPKLAFIEHKLAGDETNWWAPNAGAVEAMVRSAGLEPVSQPAHETWICRPLPGFEQNPDFEVVTSALRIRDVVSPRPIAPT